MMQFEYLGLQLAARRSCPCFRAFRWRQENAKTFAHQLPHWHSALPTSRTSFDCGATMASPPFPNVWHLRTVAEASAKSCMICYKPTTAVLITPDHKVRRGTPRENSGGGLTTQDFFYVCRGHLKDKSFCSPVVDEAEVAAKQKKEALEKEIEAIKKEYEEKLKKEKEAKGKDQDKEKAGEQEQQQQKQVEKERDDKVRASRRRRRIRAALDSVCPAAYM